MNEFQGKVAIVTGGTSGIGRAAALAFAREGARVVVAGRRAAEGAETVRLVGAQGGEALFVTTDVSKAPQVWELVDRTMQKFGRLDFAFNNAGIEQQPTSFLEQDEETYDRVMDINVKGVWLSMKYEIPAMLKTGGGSIVNTSAGIGSGGHAGHRDLRGQQACCDRPDQVGRRRVQQTRDPYQCGVVGGDRDGHARAASWSAMTPKRRLHGGQAPHSDGLARSKKLQRRPSGYRPASRRS